LENNCILSQGSGNVTLLCIAEVQALAGHSNICLQFAVMYQYVAGQVTLCMGLAVVLSPWHTSFMHVEMTQAKRQALYWHCVAPARAICCKLRTRTGDTVLQPLLSSPDSSGSHSKQQRKGVYQAQAGCWFGNGLVANAKGCWGGSKQARLLVNNNLAAGLT
jgi:hypothetical protein